MTFDYKSCPLKKRPIVYMEDENFEQYNTNYITYEEQSEALALIKTPQIELPQDLSTNSCILNLSKSQVDTPLNLSANNAYKVNDSIPNYFQQRNDNSITYRHVDEYLNNKTYVNNQVTERSLQYTADQYRRAFTTAAGCNRNNSFWSIHQGNVNAIYPSPDSSIASDASLQSVYYNCQQISPPLSPKSEINSEPEDLSITKDIPLPALFHGIYENAKMNSPTNSSSRFNYGCSGYSKSSHSSENGNQQTRSCRLKCDNCHKWYSSVAGLSKHQQMHCLNEQDSKVQKEFQCGDCGKQYHTSGALKMHIRTHTLPCKCVICGKAFSRPWLLRGHIRTHTGEKPFKCPDCSRSFADRSNLKAHQQTHSNTKKHVCKQCNKSFSRISLLKKHLNGICTNTASH